MTKLLSVMLAFAMIALCACTHKDATSGLQKPIVTHTFKQSSTEEQRIWTTYYELSDGTWKTDNYVYKYCLELSGEVPGTDTVWKFTVLSNREDLTFDDAFWASGFSSNLADYFSPEEAQIVRTDFNILE